MKRILSLVVLSALLLCAVSSVWAEPVKIQYKFTAGEIDKYKMTMNMKMDAPGMPGGEKGMNMSMNMVIHQKTLGILPDGSAKILYTYKDFNFSAPGMPAPPKDDIVGKSITITMGRDGSIIKYDAGKLAKGMDLSGMMGQMGIYSLFPKEPIEVGQSWTQAVPIPMMGGNMNVTSTLLAADEPLWSRPSCKIRQVFDSKMDLGQMMQNMMGAFAGGNPEVQKEMSGVSGELNLSGWGVTYFCPEIGKLLKTDGSIAANVTMNMPPQAVQQGAPAHFTMTLNMDMNMTRFK